MNGLDATKEKEEVSPCSKLQLCILKVTKIKYDTDMGVDDSDMNSEVFLTEMIPHLMEKPYSIIL